MATLHGRLMTDDDINRIIEGDDGGDVRVGASQTADEALEAAYQVLSQVTGATADTQRDDVEANRGEVVRAIWGSSVEVSQVMSRVFRFVRNFKKDGALAQQEGYYVLLIRQLYTRKIFYLNLNMQNVRLFDEDLYWSIVRYPQEIIPIFDAVFAQIYKALFMDDENREQMESISIETRPFGLDTRAMRDLDPEDIDTLVTIRGMIIRAGTVLPDMHVGFFECTVCKETVTNRVQDGRILEPTKCPRCGMRDSMAMIHNRCVYIDKQIVKLQEAPETVPEGATPQTVQLATHDSLVDYCKPGDKVLVTGIFRASQVRELARASNVRQLFKTYVDVVHFKRTERGSLSGNTSSSSRDNGMMEGQDPMHGDYTSQLGADGVRKDIAGRDDLELLDRDGQHDDEVDLEEKRREEEFRRLAARPDIYDILVRSLAPSVWEMEDVKKGILCQLFGGSSKVFAEKSAGKFRAEINILLCGDPGTSKSQLLQYVHKLAPRGIYTSGKGSSAVGLTAYITRDEETGEAVLESGALTLSDRGICCIDEFDKMSDATRSILHEAMEQQTVSVAKAGIIATLNARTSILASANPRESRYNKKLSVVENIQLPPTLLSRFDLIYLVLDNPTLDSDARLARHIIAMYSKDRMIGAPSHATAAQAGSHIGRRNDINKFGSSFMDPDAQARREFEESGNLTLSTETLRRYIDFAKRTCTPMLSDEAGQALVKGYLSMRRKGAGQNMITATTRQLESLIRLSEALAKMRLSNYATAEDVTEAIRLMETATYQAALDPTTGRLDMDLINTGRGAAHELQIRTLVQQLTDILRQYNTEMVSEERLFSTAVALSSDPISQSDFLEALHLLEEDGSVAITGTGRTRNIRSLY